MKSLMRMRKRSLNTNPREDANAASKPFHYTAALARCISPVRNYQPFQRLTNTGQNRKPLKRLRRKVITGLKAGVN
jgi:hypothetical protein